MGSPPITSFRGQYAFLSNFHPSPVRVHGLMAPTVEHAFQAAKATGPLDCQWVLDAPTPQEAKKRGKIVRLRADWHAVRVDVMRELLLQKFAPGTELAEKLLATGDAELIETNHWGDTYWGVCRGTGQNHLGKLLMDVRRSNRSSDGQD